jgi:hypothetical protein
LARSRFPTMKSEAVILNFAHSLQSMVKQKLSRSHQVSPITI